MKRIALIFMEKVVFGVLSMLIPRKERLLLFGTGFRNFSDNPKFLFLHFQNHEYYQPVWISPNRNEVKLLRQQGFQCNYKWSLDTFWLVLRAPIFFISHNVKDIYPVVPSRGVVINLWHGTPIKKIGFNSPKELIWIENSIKSGRKLPYDRWNYFVTASSNTNFIFEGAMRLHASKIKPLGQPRTEYINTFKNNQEFKKIKYSKLGLVPPVEKYTTVLYTPTFRNQEASTLKIKETLIAINKTLESKKDIVLLFKPHPLDGSTFDDRFFSSLNSIINVSKEDTQDLLCISDVLITDYSSIFFDFMLTERPIIAYIFDKDSYIPENGGLYFSFEELQSKIANTEEELIRLIERAKELKGEYDSEKFNLLESSKRIEDFILDLKY